MEATFTQEGRKFTLAILQLADKVPAHRQEEFISFLDNYMKGYNDGLKVGARTAIEKANSLSELANLSAIVEVEEERNAEGSTN